MSTAALPERPGEDARQSTDTRRGASFLSRLLTWYQAAVSEPETEREKAEWQQDSF